MLKRIALGLVAVVFLGVAPNAFAYQSFCSECQWHAGVNAFRCYWVNRDASSECFASGSICEESIPCYYY